jgi:hypothetical protein
MAAAKSAAAGVGDYLRSTAETARRDDQPYNAWKDIVLGVPNLPVAIRSASVSLVQERVLDQALFETLTSQVNPGLHAEAWTARLQLRERNLLSYMDSLLVCIFFRLPGCHYTFEIDPQSDAVVHWEWQPA